jgi:hypothetical protein
MELLVAVIGIFVIVMLPVYIVVRPINGSW